MKKLLMMIGAAVCATTSTLSWADSITWTGAADSNPLNANNWRSDSTGEPMLPTSADDALVSGNAVNLQIPSGTAFVCKSFTIGDCAFAANCDWRGLSVRPTLTGTANLNGHELTLNLLSAESGATFSGGDGSAVAFIPDESATMTLLSETAYIDGIANLTLSGSAKLLFHKKDGGGTLTATQMLLGSKLYTEMVQTNGTVNLGDNKNKIGDANGKTGVYIMQGGTLTSGSDSEFIIGANGTGTFSQSGGNTTANNWISLGRYENGNGTCTVNGGTLTAMKSSHPLWIAGDKNSTGRLNIGGDGVVTLDGIKMCAQNKAGMNAYLDVSGNGRLTVNTWLRTSEGNGTETTRNATITQSGGVISIGRDMNLGGAGGTASFTQSAGTLTSGSTICVGDGRSTTCTATMDIGGTVNADGGIEIGAKSPATGTLIVRNGGVLNTKYARRGEGKAYMTFDGGTVTAKASDEGFFGGFDNLFFNAGGVTINTANYNIGITNCIYAEAQGSSLVKTGDGTLTVDALPPVDAITVANGVLALDADCDNSASASLAHRWSFTSDLTDSVTGKVGEKYGTGTTTFSDGVVKLPGGSKGTCYIDLGAKKLPSDSLTIEVWLTLREVRNWVRAFVIGGSGGIVFNTRWNSAKYNYGCSFVSGSDGDNQITDKELEVDKPYYVAITFMPDGNGGETVGLYLKEVGSDGFLWTNTYTKENWSVSAGVDPTEFWLGHSTGNDNDMKGDFDEVRVWRGALSADAIALSAAKGPDATAADLADIVAKNDETVTIYRALSVASGATLDLGTGNTLRQPVLNAGGTLANGTLVVTERVNATVGETMTVASGALLDLTGASVSLTNPESLTQDGCVIATSPSGGIVPAPSRRLTGDLQGYKLFLTPTKAYIGKSGFIISFM